MPLPPKYNFLPNVPTDYILKRLSKAGGNEAESGKLLSAQSSAALVIDTFGPYIQTPEALPSFPGLGSLDSPATYVDIEYTARFPWSGGRHPWLDAVIKTPQHLIGVESKRFEPYRGTKTINLSDAYWRNVWGDNMGAYELLRDDLKSKKVTYRYLDAAQLVKHAFGLRTDAVKRLGLKPVLVYLHVETPRREPVKVTAHMLEAHQNEIRDFATRVSGAEVTFLALSYGDWLASFSEIQKNHAIALKKKYNV